MGQSSKIRTSRKPTKEICVLDGTSATATKKALASINTVAPGITTLPTGPSAKQTPSGSLRSIRETEETDKPRRVSLESQKGHQYSLIAPATSSRNSSAPTPVPMAGQPGSAPSRTGSQEVHVYSSKSPPTGEETSVPAPTPQTIHPAPGTQGLQAQPHTMDHHLPPRPFGQQLRMSHYPRLEPAPWAQAPYLPGPFQFLMPGKIPPPGQQPQSHDVVSNGARGSTKLTATCPMPSGPRGNIHVRSSSPRATNTNFQKGRNQSGILPARGLPWSDSHFHPHMQEKTSGSGPSSESAPTDSRGASALLMGSSGPPHVPRSCEPVSYHNPKGRKSNHDQTIQHGNATEYMHAPQHRTTNPGLDSRGGLDRHASNSRHEPQVSNVRTQGNGLSSQMPHHSSTRRRGDTVSSSRSISQDPSCLNWEQWHSNALRGNLTYDPCPCQFCNEKDRSIYLASFTRQEIETRGTQQSIWKEFSKYGFIEKQYLDPKPDRYTITIRYREKASVFRALKDGDRRFFNFCDHHSIRVSHPWGSQFYVPPHTSSHMLAQPGTLPHQSVRNVFAPSGSQAGSPLAAHSTAAPGVSDVLDHMKNDMNRQVSRQLHGSHGKVTANLGGAELSPKEFDVPERDTASVETQASEKSSDALLTKIQELVSTRSSRAGSLSQDDHQAAASGVPALPTQEQYNSSDDKEVDRGTVIHRPNKGKHGALPVAWNQQAGSDVNESTSITRNTSSRILMVDCTNAPGSPQKSKSAMSRDQDKKTAAREQPEMSTPQILTIEDHGIQSVKSPWQGQKRAGRSTLNPMGFDLHGSPQRGPLTQTQDSFSFMKHPFTSGSTEDRPEYGQQMHESQRYRPGAQSGQQYRGLAVKKQRELQGHGYQPSTITSSSQKPSYSSPTGGYGPPLGYSTLGLPYPSPPNTSAITGSGQPWGEQWPSAEQEYRAGQNKLNNGSVHVYYRESSIPFPPYVEPPSIQPSAVAPFVPRGKPSKKGGKKKKLNPEAKEFVAPTPISSASTATMASVEVREFAVVPKSPTSKGPTSRPATPASPWEPNSPGLPSKQPPASLSPVRDDASEASSRTMTADDDAVKEKDCKPVGTPPTPDQTKDNTLDEGKGPNVSGELAIEPSAESQPATESSQPKYSEKPDHQPVDKPAVDLRDAAPEGNKKKEPKQGKQWSKNKHFKKGHKRQEARGDVDKSWRRVDREFNQVPIVQGSEFNEVKDTASAAPSASGDRGSRNNLDQGQDHHTSVAISKEISLPKEKNPTKAPEEMMEKAVISVEHDPLIGPELEAKMQTPARDTRSADTRYSSGLEKRVLSVAVPLIVPGKTDKSVEPPKTESWASSKAETPAVPGSEGNPQDKPDQKTAGQEFSKRGNTPKQKKPAANNKEEPSSMQAQPPRYVPGANWVEEPKDSKRSKKPKATQSLDKNSSASKDGGSPAKKEPASAPPGPTEQPKTEPQASKNGQVATDKTVDSTTSSPPDTITTKDTLAQKDDGGPQTDAQASDTTGPSTAKSPAPPPQPSKAQKTKNKKRAEAARKKEQAGNAPTTEPAATPMAEPALTSHGGAGTAAPEKAGQPQAKTTDTAKPPGRSAPPPITTSPLPKNGPKPLPPASTETSPKKPGRAPKKTKGKDDGGSPETLLEGEERK